MCCQACDKSVRWALFEHMCIAGKGEKMKAKGKTELKSYTFHTPIGEMTVYEKEGGIFAVAMREKIVSGLDGKIAGAYRERLDGKCAKYSCEQRPTELLLKAERELLEYFAGERKAFDLPLHLEGTPFQLKVWNALLTIPYGETRSYKEIAQVIGNEKACRAVGMANNRNSVMILVPCHRVIGADGGLVGYGGGLALKEKLLELEKKNA